MYTFLFFSVSVIQSLFISVIEDAYVSIKYIKKEDQFYGKTVTMPLHEIARGRIPEDTPF